jgi:hypothetical protein
MNIVYVLLLVFMYTTIGNTWAKRKILVAILSTAKHTSKAITPQLPFTYIIHETKAGLLLLKQCFLVVGLKCGNGFASCCPGPPVR